MKASKLYFEAFLFLKTMVYVYILYSERLDRFYTGATQYEPEQRLAQHNNKHFPKAFTFSGIPWELFFSISCHSLQQAKGIEQHIKKMKSKTYIQNLKKYPEMSEKLLQCYQES